MNSGLRAHPPTTPHGPMARGPLAPALVLRTPEPAVLAVLGPSLARVLAKALSYGPLPVNNFSTSFAACAGMCSSLQLTALCLRAPPIILYCWVPAALRPAPIPSFAPPVLLVLWCFSPPPRCALRSQWRLLDPPCAPRFLWCLP
jgi:hypothetical protein